MKGEVRKKYLFAFGALVLGVLLALFLGLDFKNAGLLIGELRFPRLILGMAVGAGLALSGLVLQTILSNPLAEPYTLGVASGAALGAAMGVTFGLGHSLMGFNPGAILGAGLVIGFLLRMGVGSFRGQDTLILVGVMLSLVAASLLSVWMVFADPSGVQGVSFWLLGDLSRGGLLPAFTLLSIVLLIGGYFFVFSRNLDAFLFGEEMVESFGVSFRRTQMISIILISFVTGLCVSVSGIIGFVGLVVPHLVRRWFGSERHFHLIPFTLIWGAALLVISDSLARYIGEPRELPVGAVTSLVGVPIFLLIYLRQRKGGVL